MPDHNQELSPAERLDWLRLLRSQNVGPATFRTLLAHFGDAGTALAALPELAQRGGGRRIKACTRADAEAELAAAEALGARLIACCETAYPPALKAIAEPPPLLYLLGDAAWLQRPAVAIVGARNASANARRFARELAGELGAAGFVVVSGLARGIDTAAHDGALATGTVAVVAGGIDHVYPAENQGLYEAICAAGAVLSERPVGLVPQARDFPRRNRLVSGLALGVVVVEAALRSGSLITARFALEQGREVFAVPGSPLDPRARGCNRLIRDGAVLTDSAADVCEILQPMVEARTLPPPRQVPLRPAETASTGPAAPGNGSEKGLQPKHLDATDLQARLVGLLGPEPVEVDELVRQAELTPAAVITILLELELAGRIRRHPGNRVSIC